MKINNILATAAAGVAFAGLWACSDGSSIGESLVNDQAQVVIDSSFTLTGQSVRDSAVLSRTIIGLVGNIDAPGYGRLSSDVVAQFMPAINIDTVGMTADNIDSLRLVLTINRNAFTGDSIAPLGLTAYRITRRLPSPIYSDFNPADYFDPSKPLGSAVYSTSTLGETDSIRKLSYLTVRVPLPASLGRELYQAYLDNPGYFTSPTTFAEKVFGGLYIRNTYGSGRVTRIATTTLAMYYHRTMKVADTDRDTVVNAIGQYFAVTPEVVANNNINLRTAADIDDAVAQGQTIVMAPAGLNVDIKLPIREIIDAYQLNITNLGIINTLSMRIPALKIPNKYNITPPPYLLMVLKNKKDEFFAKNQITDDKTSFYAPYTSANGGSYSFSGLREYLIEMMKKGRENITDDDVTFTLVPVEIATESTQSSYYYTGSTYVTGITPYVLQPAMARLDLQKAKITLVYSKQTIKF